jgi:hypothetical protein
MAEPIEALEQRILALRTAVRQAVAAGERGRARTLRAELKDAERIWEEAVARLEDSQPEAGGAEAGRPARPGPPSTVPPGATRPDGPLLPLREQVYQALSLLTVPAAPRLISAVHEAFFAGPVPAARLTSLRRDEERSFRAAPFARPYYICAALTADLLAPARGLLAISTWPMDKRVIGSLSPRVDYLTAAIRVAESIERIPDPGPAVRRLLWRFAANIPGAVASAAATDPRAVARAAHAELEVHAGADLAVRRPAAARARRQLDDAQQLFGSRLRGQPGAGTAS